MTERDVFAENPTSFQALGQEYEFRKIPSVHFTAVMSEVIGLIIRVGAERQVVSVDAGEIRVNTDHLIAQVQDTMRKVLGERIFLLMADVINYQNNPRAHVTAKELEREVSLIEMAKFTGLVLQHDEVLDAVEEIVNTAGKLLEKVPGRLTAMTGTLQGMSDRLATLKSTPSSPSASDSTTTTSPEA